MDNKAKNGEDYIFNNLTIKDFICMVKGVFESDEFDSNGSINGYPIFERMEDRKKSNTDIEGIIPLLCNLMNKRFSDIYKINREHRYPLSNYRCDIVVNNKNSNEELWVELKQHWTKPCTPYDTEFLIDDYKRDVEKFAELKETNKKGILLIAYEKSADFPQYIYDKLSPYIAESFFYSDNFTIVTKSNGKCTCHLLFWLINKILIKNDSEIEASKQNISKAIFEKNNKIDMLITYLDNKCINGIVNRYYKPESDKNPAYYGYFLQRRGWRGWILICWSDEFETKFGTTSYWIEFSDGPAQKFIKKNSAWKTHPSKPMRVVVPINLEEFDNPEKLSEKIYNMAVESFS
jgi:hypothetical protein